MKISAEQAASFSIAVRAATRDDIRAAVENVYVALADAIELRKPVCSASGRCCRFEEFGHRLFVTTIEMAAFLSRLGDRAGQPNWDGNGCLFQVSNLCSVHAIRPFGCRIFFCDESSDDWQTQQYERLHRELKRLHDEMSVPYFYVEWREALAAMGYQPVVCVPPVAKPMLAPPNPNPPIPNPP